MLLRYLKLLVTDLEIGNFPRGAHWKISTCVFNIRTWLDLLTKSHEFKSCPLIGIMKSLGRIPSRNKYAIAWLIFAMGHYTLDYLD